MKENRELMMSLHRQGKTYAVIGAEFGISRQRVHQVVRGYNTKGNGIIKSKLGVSNCQICNVSAEHARMELHHKDKNIKNNDPTNLQVLCARCHRAIEPVRHDTWKTNVKGRYQVNPGTYRIRLI